MHSLHDNSPSEYQTIFTGHVAISSSDLPCYSCPPASTTAEHITPLVKNSRQYRGIVLSCLIHLCLLGGLYAFGQEVLPPRVVYHVSLALMPHAGSSQGGSEGNSASVSASVPLGLAKALNAGARPAPITAPAPTTAVVEQSKTWASAPKTKPVIPTPAPRQTAVSRATPASSSTSSLASPLSPKVDNAQSALPSLLRQSDGGTQRLVNGSHTATKNSNEQGTTGEVFTVQQVDTMPRLTRKASPVYPPIAKKKGVTGRVIVRLVVDADGRPTQYAVQSADPQGYFEESALEAVARMRFTPGKKRGQPVNTLVLLPFDFRLR